MKKLTAYVQNGLLLDPISPVPVVYDFELCVGLEELKQTIRTINDNGYALVSVTQSDDVYTVFFGRPAHEDT